jgi:YHS domain-containing protein
MTVDTTRPGAVLVAGDGTTTYFCSDHCKHRFAAASAKSG